MRRPVLAARLLSAFGVTLAVVAAVAEPRVIDIPLRAGALGKEQRVIRVRQGDEVTLRLGAEATVGYLEVHPR
jgi:hypothetical protein